MAFVDVSRKSRRAVKHGGTVFARVHLRRVLQTDVPLLAHSAREVFPAHRAQVALGRAEIQRRLALGFITRFVKRRHVLFQVRLTFELLPTVRAIIQTVFRSRLGKSRTRSVPVAGGLVLFFRRGRLGAFRVPRFGFVPPPVRGQVRRAAEELVAFGASVLDPDDPGALVLGQREGISVRLSAQLTHELSERLVSSCALRSGLLLQWTFFNLQAQHWRSGHLVLKLQFPHSFGFLGRGFAFALCVWCGSFRGCCCGAGSVAVAGADFKIHGRERREIGAVGRRREGLR